MREGGKKRYAATVEKGPNAWRQEWSGFMSGVNMKRLRDGTSSVALKASADIEQQSVAGGGETAAPVFSYLFASPADRRAERLARDRADAERREEEKRQKMAEEDPMSVLSRHQRVVAEAEQRGLQFEGLNRKQRREFLHLTQTPAQMEAEEKAKDFKLHDLMDERMAWYQQGPHPVDLIAEKLVRRKAEKKAKQLNLRYNYLTPHPSWIAKRAERRRQSLLVGLGKRLTFAEDEDTVTDPLYQRTVPLADMKLLLCSAAACQLYSHNDEDNGKGGAAAATVDSDNNDHDGGDEAQTSIIPSSSPPSTAPPQDTFLPDPSRLRTSIVRSVVRNRQAAVAIQQANLSTNYLSRDLIAGPNLAKEDASPAAAVAVMQQQHQEIRRMATRTSTTAVTSSSRIRPLKKEGKQPRLEKRQQRTSGGVGKKGA